jgi:predicted DNA-binding protein
MKPFCPTPETSERKAVTMMLRLGSDRLRRMEYVADKARISKAALVRQMIDHCLDEFDECAAKETAT